MFMESLTKVHAYDELQDRNMQRILDLVGDGVEVEALLYQLIFYCILYSAYTLVFYYITFWAKQPNTNIYTYQIYKVC